MGIARQRVLAASLGAVALIAVWSPAPAQAAMCQGIPGSTPGVDIFVAGQPHRVPGIDNLSICGDAGFVPLPTVTFDGRGTCTFACISVIVPGGPTDFPSATLSFTLDGSPQTVPIDAGGGPGGTELCLLSVGGPDAPYPTCSPGVAVGPDVGDPTSGVLELVQQQLHGAEQTARNAAGGAVTTAEALVTYAGGVVNAAGDGAAETAEGIVQFVLETVGPVADNAEATACAAIPEMGASDGTGNWYTVEFCDDPVTWATMAQCSLAVQWDPENGGEINLCDRPANWFPPSCGGPVGCIMEALVPECDTRLKIGC